MNLLTPFGLVLCCAMPESRCAKANRHEDAADQRNAPVGAVQGQVNSNAGCNANGQADDIINVFHGSIPLFLSNRTDRSVAHELA